MTFDITQESDAAGLDAEIRRGISHADPVDVGPRDYEALSLALRDDAGALCGGLYGATMWRWLMIDGLWIHTDLRRRGLGAKLLNEAEAVAIRRGCIGASLGTFDFQARAFYERQGYRLFGELSGFPPGHSHFQLAKRFVGETTRGNGLRKAVAP